MTNLLRLSGHTRRAFYPMLRCSLRISRVSLALCAALLISIFCTGISAQTPLARPVPRLLSISSPVNAAMRSHPSVTRAASTAVATAIEQRAFDLVNAGRIANGGSPLVWDAELCLMARMHSENMARQGFFDHMTPDGVDMKMRARALGIRGWSLMGENIAYNQGFDDPVAFAVTRWMQSSGHRENIVRTVFTHAGLGIAQAADGRVFFTQVFITR